MQYPESLYFPEGSFSYFGGKLLSITFNYPLKRMSPKKLYPHIKIFQLFSLGSIYIYLDLLHNLATPSLS